MAEFQVVLRDGDDGLIGPILLLLFGCTMTSFYTTLRAFVLTDRENIMSNSTINRGTCGTLGKYENLIAAQRKTLGKYVLSPLSASPVEFRYANAH
ncbi:hypothetical protein M0802_001327 [Mischocyttarus mexicanus]|nr:hypothetical protein M0802_001327 [Mischocyttarus mexicanus]